jgi:hypothetical protein
MNSTSAFSNAANRYRLKLETLAGSFRHHEGIAAREKTKNGGCPVKSVGIPQSWGLTCYIMLTHWDFSNTSMGYLGVSCLCSW